ncbi:7920_t:CDS:2 [Cetraspora pellucida]|uniref:7920_t:CDS:1 n=1 Tax=Cetraspora pellucida TaxID=1433469 RepID=A0ACA9MLS2_9GLOM|nr:7920_t:CDS:2 [Cetraspora pellucida]
MPRPNKRKQQISALLRKQGRYTPQRMVQEVEMMDDEISLMEVMEDEVIRKTPIMQKETAELKRKRSSYTGISRTTVWRKKQKADTSLTTLLANALSLVLQSSSSRLSIEITEPKSSQTATHNSLSINKKKLEMRLNEINQKCKMNANIHLAQTIWGKGDSMAKRIRKWGNHYIEIGELLVDHQGKHAKLKSLIKNKDFSDDCRAWLHNQKPESRSPGALKMYIERTVFLQMAEQIKKNTISERTCRTYMHLWGFRYDKKRKEVYYNGHERADVVIYRREWLNRMFTYKKYMKSFDGDRLEIIIEPELEPDEKELVQVIIIKY